MRNGGLHGRTSPTVKGAGLLAWVSGLGFGLPGLYAAHHLVKHGEIATVMGYPTYGRGIFETKFGMRTTLPLLASFVAVCAAECATGALLWKARPAGRTLALGLLPIETVFWVGFSLPYGPVVATGRTLLVIRGRSTLI